jgi:hypothetical protein
MKERCIQVAQRNVEQTFLFSAEPSKQQWNTTIQSPRELTLTKAALVAVFARRAAGLLQIAFAAFVENWCLLLTGYCRI